MNSRRRSLPATVQRGGPRHRKRHLLRVLRCAAAHRQRQRSWQVYLQFEEDVTEEAFERFPHPHRREVARPHRPRCCPPPRSHSRLVPRPSRQGRVEPYEYSRASGSATHMWSKRTPATADQRSRPARVWRRRLDEGLLGPLLLRPAQRERANAGRAPRRPARRSRGTKRSSRGPPRRPPLGSASRRLCSSRSSTAVRLQGEKHQATARR